MIFGLGDSFTYALLFWNLVLVKFVFCKEFMIMQLKILNYPLFYSASIGEKSRENLLKNLNDHLVNLACSKHGSRSIDAIWNKARTTISYWKKKIWNYFKAEIFQIPFIYDISIQDHKKCHAKNAKNGIFGNFGSRPSQIVLSCPSMGPNGF